MAPVPLRCSARPGAPRSAVDEPPPTSGSRLGCCAEREERALPSKVPPKNNQKKQGKTLKEKRAAKQEKRGK